MSQVLPKPLPPPFRLVQAVAWLAFCGVVVATALTLERQEAALQANALEAVRRGEQHQEAWRAWDRRTPPPLEWLEELPEAPEAGLALTRLALSSWVHESNRVLPRAATLPLLLDIWYASVPPSSLSDGEVALLAWGRLPQRQLEPHLRPLSVALGVAVDPALSAEVRRRCPGGCPPLTGVDPMIVQARFLALLASRDDQARLAALDVVIRGGLDMVPGLEALARDGSPHVRARAFVALQRLLPAAERRASIEAALRGDDPGPRLLAMLEAVRSLEVGLADEIEGLSGINAPPGAGVVARYVAGLLREHGEP